MKRVFTLIFILLFLAACSEEEQISPNERFDDFVSYWEEQEFEKMYEMFSTETKENISTEDSVERYEKIYEDLAIDNLHITYTEITDEHLETIREEEQTSVTLPFTVEMESIGGPISFDYEATLFQEPVSNEEDAEDSWYVLWDAGFIHPELKDGGQVRIQTVTPERGEILDRNQMPLAMNDILYEIGIVPDNLGDNPEQSKEQIANLLNISVDRIEQELSAGWVEGHLFVPITTILPTDEVYDELKNVPGIMRRDVTARIYPGGEATAHLVGYIGDITAEFLEETDSDEYGLNDKVGRRGLEQLYEERLKGKRGMTISIQKENGEDVVIAEKPVENGENISLTIDINIQERIYNSFEDDAGTAAAIDPKTGETLALVSAPAFDPNEILYGSSGNVWGALEDNEQMPLVNRFAATFAPGSVVKPITAAVGLTQGTLDPNEEYTIEGLQWGKGDEWGDYQVTRVTASNGPVDLRDALERSDNIYFAMQALELESDRFIEGFENFGFEEDLPFAYPIISSSISADGDIGDEVLLVNSSYGQGELEMSALHIAASYTPFLNEGNLLQPTLLLDEETGQYWKENVMSEEHADLIADILRSVVTDGTGSKADEANVPIAGKTGTVELKLSAEVDGSENSWFVGYPHEEQDILIALLVEETEDKESGLAIDKVVDAINYKHPDEEQEDES